ncbi:EAL and HDOD domain-containing protein [Sanguibacter antarcticus]|uniref:EAL and modified HD-GYP domain-containing signal transduction protein n=1 Tax=Sanguibacter antarcticus TaxID=372484 RepID=A0A2A9E1H1_9MICO|nr:HDOD domain-containing protein [Sanguibacter antarcticus]PFG32215.1 EAL and modified HD-GYP domain-containing signal transduction protein [Sanguibacter antarcticus]
MSTAAPAFSRLAIVDRQRRVLAYALPITNAAGRTPADLSALLHEAYESLDLEKYIADRPAFIWGTAEMLDGTQSLPPASGGLGLLIHPNATLRADGAEHVIALSEHKVPTILVNFEGTPGQRALLPFVTHVMIDISNPALALPGLIEIAHNAGISVIAENVRGKSGPAKAWTLGVDYIMGSIYQHERPAAQRSLAPGEIQCLEVVRLLAQDEVDTARIAAVLGSDPEMAVRVLHLVNSVAVGLPQRVDSLHRSIVMLGPTRLTTLVMASLISSRVQQMDALWFLLARAAACRELIGDDTGYTVGLLSAFAEETGIPIDILIEKTLVSAEVAAALSSYEGELGATLRAVVAHEHGDIQSITETSWTPEQVSEAYLTALPWALDTVRQLNL